MDQEKRREVRERADNRCEYCRLRQEYAPFPRFHIEHIRPIKHGGTDDLENLCLACGQCNLHKSSNLTGIDPESDQINPLFHPRLNQWHDHFTFNDATIQGLTSIGRATVRTLNMNDSDRLQIRAALLELGELDS